MELGPAAGEFLILWCFEKGVVLWSIGYESNRLIMLLADCRGSCD